jgi:hypothetical protein
MNALKWTGCPCGCESTPWYDDPDCWRHRPVEQRDQQAAYDVVTLGLVPHNRATCVQCIAVGA